MSLPMTWDKQQNPAHTIRYTDDGIGDELLFLRLQADILKQHIIDNNNQLLADAHIRKYVTSPPNVLDEDK